MSARRTACGRGGCGTRPTKRAAATSRADAEARRKSRLTRRTQRKTGAHTLAPESRRRRASSFDTERVSNTLSRVDVAVCPSRTSTRSDTIFRAKASSLSEGKERKNPRATVSFHAYLKYARAGRLCFVPAALGRLAPARRRVGVSLGDPEHTLWNEVLHSFPECVGLSNVPMDVTALWRSLGVFSRERERVLFLRKEEKNTRAAPLCLRERGRPEGERIFLYVFSVALRVGDVATERPFSRASPRALLAEKRRLRPRKTRVGALTQAQDHSLSD